MGEVTRLNKQLVHKCKVVTTIPLHLIPCIDLLTLCEIEPRKFLGLEIYGYLILRDFSITSPDFSCSKLKSCSKQVTRFLELKHQVYHHDWHVGGFGNMLSFNKHGN
jgi:hypothetical protein